MSQLTTTLRQLIGLFVRDFIHSWHGTISTSNHLPLLVEKNIHRVIEQLAARGSTIDWLDVTTNHLPNLLHLHIAQSWPSEHPGVQHEEEYLKRVAWLILAKLIDNKDFESSSVNAVLVNVVDLNVLKLLLDTISDPNTIYFTIDTVIECELTSL